MGVARAWLREATRHPTRMGAGVKDLASKLLQTCSRIALLLWLTGLPGLAEPGPEQDPELPFVPGYWGARQLPSPPPEPGLTIGGQIQIDAAAGSLGSLSNGSTIPIRNGLSAFPADTSIYLRRGRLSANYQFDADNRVFVNVQYDTVRDKVTLFDAFYERRLFPGGTVTVGQLKPRFGWEALRQQWNLNTIERSDVSEALRPIRDLGVNLNVQKGAVQADLGLFTGQDQNTPELNSARNLVGRLAYWPDQSWVLGASFQKGSITPDVNALELPVASLGVELRYYDRPFAVEAEHFWSQGYNRASRADTPARGFYVTGLYEIDERFDLVLSQDWFDPDESRIDLTFPDNATNARSRTLLGLNYYLDRAAYHRLMLNYEWHIATEGPPRTADGWRVRYQYRF